MLGEDLEAFDASPGGISSCKAACFKRGTMKGSGFFLGCWRSLAKDQ